MQWAGGLLAQAHRRSLIDIKRVAQEYKTWADKRTLIVVLCCPCCGPQDRLLNRLGKEETIFVTPFFGMSDARGKIHMIKKYPPGGYPGQKAEAATLDEYLQAFRQTIEEALRV